MKRILIIIVFFILSPLLVHAPAENIDLTNMDLAYNTPNAIIEREIRLILLTLGTIESGMNYRAVGKSTEGGAYQIKRTTWCQWSKEHFGKVVTMTTQTQDIIAAARIKTWLDSGKSVQQIASLWNSGSENWQGKTGINSYGVSFDVPAYVKKFTKVYNYFCDSLAQEK